jgi:hypothetical protein
LLVVSSESTGPDASAPVLPDKVVNNVFSFYKTGAAREGDIGGTSLGPYQMMPGTFFDNIGSTRLADKTALSWNSLSDMPIQLWTLSYANLVRTIMRSTSSSRETFEKVRSAGKILDKSQLLDQPIERGRLSKWLVGSHHLFNKGRSLSSFVPNWNMTFLQKLAANFSAINRYLVPVMPQDLIPSIYFYGWKANGMLSGPKFRIAGSSVDVSIKINELRSLLSYLHDAYTTGITNVSVFKRVIASNNIEDYNGNSYYAVPSTAFNAYDTSQAIVLLQKSTDDVKLSIENVYAGRVMTEPSKALAQIAGSSFVLVPILSEKSAVFAFENMIPNGVTTLSTAVDTLHLISPLFKIPKIDDSVGLVWDITFDMFSNP